MKPSDLKLVEYSPSEMENLISYQQIVPAVGTVFQPARNCIPAKEAFQYVPAMTKLLEALGGLGLAANQVGLDIPLFVFVLEGKIQPAYRPKITARSQAISSAVERCLSFPGASTTVTRPAAVAVEFISQSNNKRKKITLHGLEAGTFQHEYDHLMGRTIFHPY